MNEQVAFRETVTAVDGSTETGTCTAAHAFSLVQRAHRLGYRVTGALWSAGLLPCRVVIERPVPRLGKRTVTLEPARDTAQLPVIPDLRPPARRARATDALAVPGRQVTVSRREPWPTHTRYHLSNGWFVDAEAHKPWPWGYKYGVYEPGGDPSGCAAIRGAAPTLALAVAVANGAVICTQAEWGCRKVAIGYRRVTVRGTEGQVYYCEDHHPAIMAGTGRETGQS